MSALSDLPEPLIHEVLEFLVLMDRRKTLATCSRFWKRLSYYEGQIKTLRFKSMKELQGALINRSLYTYRYGPVLRNLQNLIHLNVGPFASDSLLYLLPTAPCHGTLESLSMVGSQRITDAGLMYLARANPNIDSLVEDVPRESDSPVYAPRPHKSSSLSALKQIDLTFCRNTSFAGTFWLRDGIPQLQCIRRIPVWCEGNFYTPFGSGVEIHTYWPDGTFSFTRNKQSSGFVTDLYPWDRQLHSIDIDDGYDYEAADFVGDKMQYNDPDLPDFMPEFAQYAYRPGVSLLRLPPEKDENGSTVASVLVAQYLNGLKPPSVRRWMERALTDGIAIGESKYYSFEKKDIPDDDRELREARSIEEHATNPLGPPPDVMISKMKLESFHCSNESLSAKSTTNNCSSPPMELIQSCRRTCKMLEGYGLSTLERVEEELDILLRTPPEQQAMQE
jgi:hypothetical protein